MASAPISIREFNNTRLDGHMLFVCPECGAESTTQQEWRKHLNLQHHYASKTVEDLGFKEINDKYHECKICMKWVANAHQAITLLQYHRFLHLPYRKTYRCKHCTISFARKKALCEHLYRLHNSIIIKHEKEQKLLRLKKSFEENSPKHNNEFYMKYLCPLCGKMFDRFNIWQQHIDAAHSATSIDLCMFRIQGTKNYYCKQCCERFYNGPTKSELQRHNFTHQPHPLYFQCSYCSTKKSYKTELLLHVIKSHKEVFEKYKEYIKKPDEWGGSAEMGVIRDLDKLLGEKRVGQTDILQKAIQESLLDLGGEEKELKFSTEYALDQSLQEFDDILNCETDPNIQVKSDESASEYEFDDDEVEEVCRAIFEEIYENCTNSSQGGSTEQNRKRLKLDLSDPEKSLKLNDSIQKEMQKYINYLCPECGHEFESQAIWRTHVFEEHNLANAVETKFRPFNSEKTAYICMVCYQVQRTTKASELRRHHFQHMPYQAYLKCFICTKTKSSKPKILQHLQYTHFDEIQKNVSGAHTKTMIKNLRCLDCDKLYAKQTSYEAHCRQCPQRLKPLAVGQYDIKMNMKLLDHLQKANKRIVKLLEEYRIDVDSLKLAQQ